MITPPPLSNKNILLKYDYTGIDTYQPKEVNLGDYIQSLAVYQFYRGSKPRLVDRDSLKSLHGCRGILNGWYHLNNEHHILNNDNDCLLTAVHINNCSSFPSFKKVLDSWSQFGPIGCRDLTTMQFLQKQGYDAYFSGCLTTTFGYSMSSQQKRAGILMLDATYRSELTDRFFPISRFIRSIRKKQSEQKIRQVVKNLIASPIYRNEKIIYQTNETLLNYSHERRFQKAKDLLDLYSRVKLVITSRIHCALPCLALGTPVILCVPGYDPLRYPGLDQFLNTVFVKNGILETNIRLKNNEVINPDTYKPYARKLIRQCRDFMK